MHAPIYLAAGLIFGISCCSAQVLSATGDIVRAVKEADRSVQNQLEVEMQGVLRQAAEVSQWPQNDATAKRKSDLQDTASAITKAQQAASGNVPRERRDIASAQETIRTALRPVWTVCNSTTWAQQEKIEPWKTYLEMVKDRISGIAASVGMFVYYTETGHWVANGATGFVARGRYIVTNKHVLRSYAYEDPSDPSGWHLYAGRSLRIQFPFEYENCSLRRAPLEIEIEAIEKVGEDTRDDFAILRLDSAAVSVPPPVPLSDKFGLSSGARVVAVGYPGRPISCGNGDPTPESPCTYLTEPQIDSLFQTPDQAVPFPAERISPGMILFNPVSGPDEFSYDSSTWGGSSGSPVVSLVDGSVVGIQVGGEYAKEEGVSYNNGIAITKLLGVLNALPERN